MRTLTLRIALVAVAVSLSVTAPAQQFAAPPQFAAALEEIERLTAAELGQDNIGSVTVAIVHGADTIWVKSFGLADMEEKVPATPETIYRIGSITKQFSGLMLLQLAEAGKVHLSEPIATYFPEIETVQGRQPWYQGPTFVQLATMTSGLAREPDDLPTYVVGPVSDWEKTLIAALPKVKYVSEPDTRFLYSNVGYAILGPPSRARHASRTWITSNNAFSRRSA